MCTARYFLCKCARICLSSLSGSSLPLLISLCRPYLTLFSAASFPVRHPEYLWPTALGICFACEQRTSSAIYLTFKCCWLRVSQRCRRLTVFSSLSVCVRVCSRIKWICLHEICVDLLHIIVGTMAYIVLPPPLPLVTHTPCAPPCGKPVYLLVNLLWRVELLKSVCGC